MAQMDYFYSNRSVRMKLVPTVIYPLGAWLQLEAYAIMRT
jgi:hypothetical protein